MKNGISDILNSLFSTPSDKAALSQGKDSVSAKGSQPGGSTFEEVLAQMASQDSGAAGSTVADNSGANAQPTVEVLPPSSGNPTSGSGKFFQSLTSISEADVTITEHLKVDNLAQLAQAEQTLMSLAAGLSKLIGMLSSAQSMDPTQAQNTLVSLSGGKISAADAKSLLDSLQAMISKVSDSGNPLLLSSDQQSAFLNQMLQQMLQNQQILFGNVTGSPDGGNSTGGGSGSVSGSNSLQNSDVFLQMSFSETQLVQFQQNNSQSSTVFIDLQTFQMSATFIQAGTTGLSGQSSGNGSSLQPIPSSSPLADALNQLFSSELPLSNPSVSVSASQQNLSTNTSQTQDDLNNTFKNLVQMLVQAGASQAVLTTFLNQQKDMTNSDLKQSLSQTASLDNLVKSLTAMNDEVPPAPPLDSANPGVNNTDNTRSSFASQMFVEQMFAQASVVEMAQSGPQAPAAGSQVQLNSTQSLGTSDVTPVLGTSPVVQPTVGQNSQVFDGKALDTLNDMVARLNVLASQFGAADKANNVPAGAAKPSITLEQLLNALNIAVPPGVTAGTGMAQPASSGNNSDQSTQNSLVGPDGVSAILPGAPILPQPPTQPLASQNFPNVLTDNQAASAVNEVIASAQVFQSQWSASTSMLDQNNQANITVLSQTQLIQTAFASSTAAQGTMANGNDPLANAQSGQSLGLTPVPAVQNNFVPNVSSPLTVQTPAGLSLSVQPAPQVAVVVQPQPASPVSVTVQEVVPPTPVDVQVPVNNQTDLLAQVNGQVPAATTPGTTVSVSTNQNVPATVITGEVVKSAVPVPAVPNNNDLNNQNTVNQVSSITEVQPLTPQAVISVGNSSELSADLRASLDQSKNTNNNSIDLQLNPNLLAALAADKQAVAAGLANQAVNNPATHKVDSFQILSQVMDQITTHASEAKAVSRLNFQLVPESLGRVTVQIALVDQAVSAKIIVSHPDVKEVLQHHMVDLKAALSQAGLQIDQLQVQIQGGSSNLLAQYYQYQQEGNGYRLPASMTSGALDDAQNLENTGVLGEMSVRMSLLDVLA